MLPIAGRSDSLGYIKTCPPVAKELLLREKRPSSSKAFRPVSFVLKNQFLKSLLPLTVTETIGQNHQQNNYTNTEDKAYLSLVGFLCSATSFFYIEN